jgi:hypothetical protein
VVAETVAAAAVAFAVAAAIAFAVVVAICVWAKAPVDPILERITKL